MPHPLAARRRARPAIAAAIAGALALLVLAAPAPAKARIADASYLANAPGGLHLAVTLHAGRLQAYACDGTSRRAFFTGRARAGRHVLRSRRGDRLALRLGARTVRATLTLQGGEPIALTARRARAAIYRVTIRPDGAVTGTAPAGGVLAAHLSGLGLVGALALPGREPRAFSEPGFARAPLFVNDQPVPFPPERAAEALEGEWRWLVTPTRILGATTKFINIEGDLAIPAGTKFVEQDVGI